MRYYAGIDGGQTSTQAVIADENGHVLGRGEAGPADEIAQGPESTRLRDALQGALADAVARAGLARDVRFAGVVAAVSGYEGQIYGQAPLLPADACTIVHDSQAAHAGALGGEPGVVVIAGTGSAGCGRGENGSSALVGGWGFLFGDEGSAFWLARRAVADAMRDSDSGEPGELAGLALAHFERSSLRALSRAYYANEISRARFALFASDVLRAAERGNGAAAQYVRESANALVMLAMRTVSRAGLPEDVKVAFVGGLCKSPTMRGEIAQRMREVLPNARHVQPKYDAAVGALVLAYRAAGCSPQTIA